MRPAHFQTTASWQRAQIASHSQVSRFHRAAGPVASPEPPQKHRDNLPARNTYTPIRCPSLNSTHTQRELASKYNTNILLHLAYDEVQKKKKNLVKVHTKKNLFMHFCEKKPRLSFTCAQRGGTLSPFEPRPGLLAPTNHAHLLLFIRCRKKLFDVGGLSLSRSMPHFHRRR